MPNAHDEKQKRKVESDIDKFKQLVQNAEIEYVGKDEEYVPDAPRLQRQMGIEE